MAKRIWKYQLAIQAEQTFMMPDNAKVISTAMQEGTPSIWVMLDPDEERVPVVPVKITIFGSGHKIDDALDLRFVGTLLAEQDSLVLHVFVDKDH